MLQLSIKKKSCIIFKILNYHRFVCVSIHVAIIISIFIFFSTIPNYSNISSWISLLVSLLKVTQLDGHDKKLQRKISKRNKCWFYYSTCDNLSDSFLLHQWASILAQNEISVLRRSWASYDWLTSPAVPTNRAKWKEKWSLKLWGTGPWRTQSLNCILQIYTLPSLLHSFHFWKQCYFLIWQFKNSSKESSYVVQEFTFQGKKRKQSNPLPKPKLKPNIKTQLQNMTNTKHAKDIMVSTF